jgi:hypothetical protein
MPTGGMLLIGGFAWITAHLQRLHVLRNLQWDSRPRLHKLLHRILVLAQDVPALGEPSHVPANHIHEYGDLPRAERAAMQVPSKQFLDQLIELRQDLTAVWFGHNRLSL